jgi:hypothetical protein
LIHLVDVEHGIHLSIASSYYNNSSVHTSSTSNHVLDIISVTGAVDVSIMSVVGLVLDMGGGDGDTTLALLRGLVNGAIIEEVREALFCLTLCDSGGQCGLRERIVRMIGWRDDGGVCTLP